MASSLVSLDYGSDSNSNSDTEPGPKPASLQPTKAQRTSKDADRNKQSQALSSSTTTTTFTSEDQEQHEQEQEQDPEAVSNPLGSLFSSLPAPKHTKNKLAKKPKGKNKPHRSDLPKEAVQGPTPHSGDLPAAFFDSAVSESRGSSARLAQSVSVGSADVAKAGALNPEVALEGQLAVESGVVSGYEGESVMRHYPKQYIPSVQHGYPNYQLGQASASAAQGSTYSESYAPHVYPGYNLPVDTAYSHMQSNSYTSAYSHFNPVQTTSDDISKFIPQNERKYMKQGNIDVIDINQRDVSNSVWVPTDAGKIKSLGHGTSAAKKQLSRVAKSRNHIRSLAVMALEKEYELDERNASSSKTKAETRGKYGW